jgi:hypothetical protein
MLDNALVDVTVANKNDGGLLGVVSSKATDGTNGADDIDGTRCVWLYYTETEKEGSEKCPKANYCIPVNEPIGNGLYRYELTANGTKWNLKISEM